MKSHQTQNNYKKIYQNINNIIKLFNNKIKNNEIDKLTKILNMEYKDFQQVINQMSTKDIRNLVIEKNIEAKLIKNINQKLSLFIGNYDVKLLENKIKMFELIGWYYDLAKQVYKHNYCQNVSAIRNNKLVIKNDENSFMIIKEIVEEYQNSNLTLENFCITKYSDADFKIKDLIGIDILTPTYLMKIIQIYCKKMNIISPKEIFNIDINENYIDIEKTYLIYMTDELKKGSKVDYVFNNGQKLLDIFQNLNKKNIDKTSFDSAYKIVEFYEKNNPVISGLSQGYSNLEAMYFTDPKFDDLKNKKELTEYLKKLK